MLRSDGLGILGAFGLECGFPGAMHLNFHESSSREFSERV